MISGLFMPVLPLELTAQREHIVCHGNLHVIRFETRQSGFHDYLVIRLVQVDGRDSGTSICADGARESIIKQPVHGLPKSHHFAYRLPTSKIRHSEPPFVNSLFEWYALKII